MCKQRIANLALLCLAYMTSPGIETELIEAPPAVARRRDREGKRRPAGEISATIVLPDAWAVVERWKQEAATMPKLDRITADPAVLGGKACIRGIRIRRLPAT